MKRIILFVLLSAASTFTQAQSVTATNDNGVTITTAIDVTAHTLTYSWDMNALDGSYAQIAILQPGFPRSAYCVDYGCIVGAYLTGSVISQGDGQGDQPLVLEYETYDAPPLNNSVVLKYSVGYAFAGFIGGQPAPGEDGNVTVSLRNGGEDTLWAYTPTLVPSTPPDAVSELYYPRGKVYTTTPSYTFEAVAGATWYYLWVNDATGNPVSQWFTASQANCAPSGRCRIVPSLPVSGDAVWWVQTWNQNGYGPWSQGVSFAP